ncbi:MAG: LuxR C-terminal-related transcriptional regulator [Chloroflexota bacterium]|nr:LuxR C-terminal-related transcriptional regulator [Chloroflexota bacterium]
MLRCAQPCAHLIVSTGAVGTDPGGQVMRPKYRIDVLSMVIDGQALRPPKLTAIHSTAPAVAATRLTSREREIVELVALGLSNRQIAEQLVLVTGTVANHMAHVLAKLGCANRAQVAAWAVQHDLVGSPFSAHGDVTSR